MMFNAPTNSDFDQTKGQISTLTGAGGGSEVFIALVPGTAAALRDADGSVGGVAGDLLVPLPECSDPSAYYK